MDIDIGLAIKNLRTLRGHTQDGLALLIGSDASNVSRIERNRQWPSKSILLRLAMALETTPSGIFLEAEHAACVHENSPSYRDGDALEQFVRRLNNEQREQLNKLVVIFQLDTTTGKKSK